MKEGWTYKKLGEVGFFSRGINFAKSDFVKEGFPCIHYGQIHTTFGPVTSKHLTSIPKEIIRQDKLASKGDLIIAITSEDVEGSCKCTAWMGDYDIAVGAHAAIYKHKLNPIFVSYFFKSPVFQKEKEPYVHGFKVMEIKPSDIAKIQVPVPSEEEQHSIVSRLDSAFAHIDALKANAEKQLAEARKLFQAELAECMRPKEGWEKKDFAECIDKVPKQKQVKSKDYQSSGKYPIVSQEKELISGYWDDEVYLYKHSKPIIVFGDHTKEIKFIDFDFVVGADGTQILNPKEGIDAKFFYYVLVGTPLRTLGYARHFKLLKEKTFFIPPLDTQDQIVSRLDALSANIKKLEEVQRKTLAECDALKQAILREVFE